MTPDQARTILTTGYVYGRPLTDAQRNRFAQIAGTDTEGNELDSDSEDYEEMRFGGQKNKKWPKKFTSKNIQSSKNVLMLRNYLVFGPKGKHNIYMPMSNKKKGGTPEAYPQQPTNNQFFSPTFIPHAPRAFYGYGGHFGYGGGPGGGDNNKLPGEEFNVNHIYGPDIVGYNPDGTPIYRQFQNPARTPGTVVQGRTVPKYEWVVNAPDQSITPTKKKGYSPDTAAMQQKLNAMGAGLVVDGIWGPKTQAAYDRFMKAPVSTGTSYPARNSGLQGGPNRKFEFGGNPPAFPQQPPMDVFMTNAPWQPTYNYGGQPCFECGGAMSKKKQGGSNPMHAFFSKALRDVVQKKFGGDAPQGFDMDNIIESKKSYFTNYLGKNAMNAWADEEATAMVDMHGQMMAAYGMQVPNQMGMQNPMNMQNMMQAQMLQNNIDESSDRSSQDFGNLYNAGMNMAAYANPYYEMTQKKLGGYFADGGANYMNPYGMPMYGVAPTLIPFNYQPYYRFKTNMAPGPNSFLPPGTDLSHAKNFNYDYRGRFFGAGPRRVKMSWDEFNGVPGMNPPGQNMQNPQGPSQGNPQFAPQANQNMVGNQVVPGTNGMTRDALTVNNYALNSPGMPGYDAAAQQWMMQNPQYPLPWAGGPQQTPFQKGWNGPPEMKAGGVYELSPEQIKQIMEAGGEIEYVD